MMTIRMSYDQNEHDVCFNALRFAFESGVISMRTKWFTIDDNSMILWRSLHVANFVLARVRARVGSGGPYQGDIAFASFCGVHLNGDDIKLLSLV